MNQAHFKGVTLEDLPYLEQLFEINITVYCLEPTIPDQDDSEEQDRPEIAARLIQRSHRHYPRSLHLNLYHDHFSYIKNLKQYSKSYQCSRCGKFWKDGFRLNRHEKTCEAKTRLKFPGGAYTVPSTVFEQLADEGIVVPKELRYFKYFATFDFECMLTKDDQLPKDTEKLTWTNKHVPLSVSSCSNIPGFEDPKCIITDGNTHDLLKQFVDYLLEISQESYRLLLSDFEEIFTAIDTKIEESRSGERDAEIDDMVNLLVDLQENGAGNNDDGDYRGIPVLESDDEDEEEIEEENEEDRAFLDDNESEVEDVNFYRVLNRQLEDETLEDEGEEEVEEEHSKENEKKKPHPLVKLKVII